MKPPAPVPGAWFLLGPTASGKTALSLELAAGLGAEIVCMDSMQLYRGIPIASAQPSARERARVPHHLFESLELDQVHDAGRYLEAAAGVAAELATRGRSALFVGGTVLYYRALVEGLAELPARDPGLREALRASWDRDGGAALRAELERVDPEAAARIGRNDYRRSERALEVHRLTGIALSALQARPVRPRLVDRGTVVLRAPRPWLRQRVEDRQRAMVAAGLVDELRRVWERFREAPSPPTALQAIGVRALAPCFAGDLPLDQGLATMRAQTHRLLRHQETWLRKLGRGVELDPSHPEGLAARARAALGGRPTPCG